MSFQIGQRISKTPDPKGEHKGGVGWQILSVAGVAVIASILL
jgi:hypothetical protein